MHRSDKLETHVAQPTPRLLRMPQVAERLGVTSMTLYRWISAGEFIKPIRLGGNSIAFCERELEEWIEARKAARFDRTAPTEQQPSAA